MKVLGHGSGLCRVSGGHLLHIIPFFGKKSPLFGRVCECVSAVCICICGCVYLRALRVDTNTASSGWAVKVLYNMRYKAQLRLPGSQQQSEQARQGEGDGKEEQKEVVNRQRPIT